MYLVQIRGDRDIFFPVCKKINEGRTSQVVFLKVLFFQKNLTQPYKTVGFPNLMERHLWRYVCSQSVNKQIKA